MGTKRLRKSVPVDSKSVKVVPAKEFEAAPRKARTSIYDSYAQRLVASGKSEGVIIQVPEGMDPQNYRGYVYIGMRKSLAKLGKKDASVKIVMGTKNNMLVQLATA